MGNTQEKQLLSGMLIKANQFMDQMRWSSQETYTTVELYAALDFPTNISYTDYRQRYKRQEIANRIVKSPVQGTWKNHPKIYETIDEETSFEIAYIKLVKELNLYYFLYKFDLLGALGRYSILFLGLDDNANPSIPADKSSNISFVTPISEGSAKIQTWDTNITSPRYGKPVTYKVITGSGDSIYSQSTSAPSSAQTIHWTRVIHLAENSLESETYGIPYLEPVYNRLLGMEKLAGGSPEMYWRGARPGYTAQSSDNSIITDKQLEALKDQLTDFFNNVTRWLYVEGVDISSLAPQVVSPKEHIDAQLQLISAYTRIPIRVLTGSERGQLASSQDERAWLSYLEERREEIAEDQIIRPFIDRMIGLGILPEPETGEYFVEWEPLVVLSEKEKAEISKMNIETTATYTDTGASTVIPLEEFYKTLGYSEPEIEVIMDITDNQIKEEDSLREEPEEELIP